MTDTSAPLLGALLGLLAATGILLIAQAHLRARRPDPARRIDPYLRGHQHSVLETTAPRSGRIRRGLVLVMGPVAEKTIGILERLTGGREQLERRLRLAGGRTGVDAFRMEQVLLGVIGSVAGLATAITAILARGASPLLGLMIVVLGTLAGVLGRDYVLSAQIRRRASRMAREFPTVADLLALAVAAGESPLAAMERVARSSRGALPDELATTVAEIRAGSTASQALAALSDRSPLQAITRFGDGVAVALERGTPLADVLRAQAQDAREAAKRDLLETAGRREIFMLVPVVFLVMPLVIVFALFPGLAVLEITL